MLCNNPQTTCDATLSILLIIWHFMYPVVKFQLWTSWLIFCKRWRCSYYIGHSFTTIMLLYFSFQRGFGRIVSKWHVFRKPLDISFWCTTLIVEAAFCLYDFCMHRMMAFVIQRVLDQFAWITQTNQVNASGFKTKKSLMSMKRFKKWFWDSEFYIFCKFYAFKYYNYSLGWSTGSSN